jgi:hypothetical protein
MARVRVIANPPDDDGFVHRVEELAETTETPEGLEQLLRGEYSEARVVRGVTDVVERWYAYRDGHWTRF